MLQAFFHFIMSDYIKIQIELHEPGQSEILVALLSQAGFEGFEEQDKLLQAFIPQQAYDDSRTLEILQSFSLSHSMHLIREQNWNEIWEREFEPVCVGDFCSIRASFHQPVAGVRHEVIITPKMSFGTGHHATTFLMIAAMEGVDFKDKTVFDFGTGTGVLAILAEKLGASAVEAIDMDDWSISNALENLAENQCRLISVEKGTNPRASQPVDILLANINKNVILQHLPQMGQQLVQQGVLILSGLLEQDYEEVRQRAVETGLGVISKGSREGWISIRLEKTLS